MWLKTNIIADIERVARIHYVDVKATKLWNEHRREGELRLLTGWCWTARNGSQHRQGFKTMTVAYRDAWYALIRQQEVPRISTPRVRLVSARKAS